MSLKVSIAQFGPVIADPEKNLVNHLKYIDRALEAGASLVIFPELSLTGYSLRDAAAEVAITPDDPLLDPLLEKSDKISICLGAVELSEEYFIYNSSFFLEAGEVIDVTRKVYPPTYGVFEEKRFYTQGRRARAFESRLGRFGTVICNDSRHPGLIYVLAMDGCRFLIIQSAVPARGFPSADKPAPVNYFKTGAIHYSSVYGMYVFFSNLAGYEDSLLFSGNSLITAPGGNVIAEAPLFDEAMITAEVSESAIRRYRTATPILGEEDMNLVIDELKRIKREKNGL